MDKKLTTPQASFWPRLLLGAGALLLVFVVAAQWPRERQPTLEASVLNPLPTDLASFARAAPDRPLNFPADQGPHPRYQTEWWYFTGNLADEGGARWAYQLTFFRRALRGGTAKRASLWDDGQLYLAHFALTDVSGDAHLAEERFSRGGADLAGAQAQPFHVWLENWQVREQAPGVYHLTAAGETSSLDLLLEPTKPPVLQGDDGYSQKGADPGNASYYYSLTRIQTTGTIRRAGRSHMVNGASWMDHEWSTNALGEDLVGWDWFSIQLQNKWELMVFQLRGRNGGVSPIASGALISPAGESQTLRRDDFIITHTGDWRSPVSSAIYPSGWILRVPGHDIELELTPLVRDQEMRLSTQYWEGAVSVRGKQGSESVEGFGFVELTGYAESMEARF